MSIERRLVVHIIDELPPDGAERLLVDILKHRSPDFDYLVLCLVSGGALLQEILALGVPVKVIGKKRKIDLLMFLQLVQWLLKHKPDVVHTHLFTADSWGRLAAAITRTPVIYSTVHSTNSWKNWLHRTIDRILARFSTKVIACSGEVAKVLTEKDHIPSTRIKTIMNGISLTRFDSINTVDLIKEFDISPKAISIAMVGRLHPAKGHQDILQVMEYFLRENVSCSLIIIGSGELQKDIQTQIQKRRLEQVVTLAGQRNDVLQILSAVDIFVMPSRWEGLPMALLEAMALGKAVIATAVGGIPEVINDNQNGFLVPPGDICSLQSKLRNLIADETLRKRLGKEARSVVYNRFNAAIVARQYESLYSDCLELQ